ncbi:MAG TPA: pitrilysin family protein [Flavisolibacter sp.]
MKQKVLVLASAMLCFVVVAFGQAKLVEKVTRKGSEIVIPYEKYVLPNGLTVVIHEDHSDPVVHVDVTYHVGSAREEIGKSGFAHFFEHMMFYGSDNVANGQHFKIISEAGGDLNGSTNRDRTNYYETVPSNQLEKMLWLEADRMGFLLDAVSQEKFENQRSTVKNERGQRYDNAPYGLAFEAINKNLYPYGHPYSWMTIGYVEDLNRVNVNDLKNFFLRWYGPNNATLTIGGDVKPAEVVKLVEKYFGSIPAGPAVKPVTVPGVSLNGNRYATLVDNFARLPRLYVAYPSVSYYHEDAPALDALAEILGQGKNSILYQHMVKNQKALSASAFSNPFQAELSGEFYFMISPPQGRSLKEIEDLFRASLDSFEKRGVTDEDLAKFKGNVESSVMRELQSVNGKVAQLAAYQTFTGSPNRIGEELKAYNALKKEDVMRVYNKYIKGKGAVILSVVPKGQEQLVAAEPNFTVDTTGYVAPNYGYNGLKYVKAKDNFDRSKTPGAGKTPEVKVPAFWRKDLANGIKVIGSENTELPTITMTFSIPGGHLLQSKDLSKAGLASMFAAMMNEDTKKYTAEQMALELQKLGSSINVSSGTDRITFTVQALKKNFDKTLALLQERMFNPNFTEDAFNRIKKQRLESFKVSKSQPATIASSVFARLNYGDNHILGVSQNGTEETIANITLQDVKDYFSKYMTSVDAKLVVVGDIKQADFLAKMGFLNRLPKKKVELPTVNATPAVDKTKVFLVDVPKGAQTEFRIGYATGLKYDPVGDYYRAQLANYALGGDINSRFFQNLRETKGWTYGASSGFSGDKYSGNFIFSSGIRANATDSALAEVMKEFKNFTQTGPTEDEVAYIKNAISQSEALKYETSIQKAQFISRLLEYNLPASYVKEQNKILQNLTREQAIQMANRYMNPEKMNILLVGDKQKIIDGVKKLGYEIVELDADGKVVDKKAF